MNNDLMFSSNKDDWETPQSFFDEINKEFHFSFDSACSEENTKCEGYDTDSLEHEWYGVTFCNPPYSQSKLFIKKAWEEYKLEHCHVVLLLPARTDTIAFHEYIYGKAELRFIKGRLKFEINGEPLLDKKGRPSPAPFPSMLAIYR